MIIKKDMTQRVIRALLVGWWLVLALGSQAQSAYQLSFSASMRTNYVRSMVQDKYGYVWVATTSGVGRYDGYQTEVFKPAAQGNRQLLQDARILSVKYWRDRFVWIRTRGNRYSCYDTEHDRFVDYTGNGTYSQSLKGYAFLRGGDMMVWHEKGASRIIFDGMSFHSRPVAMPSYNIVHVAETPKGEWLVMADGNIYRRHGDKYVLDYAAYLSKTIRKVYEAACKGDVLYLSTGDGVYEYNLSSRTMSRSVCSPSQAHVVSDNRGNVVILSFDGSDVYYITDRKTYHFGGIYSARLLQMDRDPHYQFFTSSSGVLWISCYGNGLMAYLPSTGEVKSYSDLLPSPYVLSSMLDKDGNVWLAVESLGITVVDVRPGKAGYVYLDAPGKVNHANDIRLLRACGKRLFVGNAQNDLYETDGSLGRMRPVNGYGDVTVVKTDRQGRLWVGTRNNGIFIDGNRLDFLQGKQRIEQAKVTDILSDRSGRVWITLFGHGLAVYEQGKFRLVLEDKNLHLRNMTVDAGGVVYASGDKGTLCFDPERLARNAKEWGMITIANMDESTTLAHTVCTYVDSKQRVWIGSIGSGLMMLSGKDTTTLTIHDGLADNNAKSIVEDSKSGDIWIGTDHGVSRWRKGKITNYSFGDSELGNQCAENAAVCLPDGRLAFATHLGVMTFRPDSIVEQKNAFPLSITKVESNGVTIAEQKGVEGLGQSLVKTTGISVAHSQNSLTFYFSDFYYSRRDASAFSYYLEGYDKGWSGLSHLNFAQYRNLPPGRYVLHVRSCNANGVWSPSEVTLRVVVRPPFYATWWAYLTYVLLLAVVLYVVYRTLRRINDLRMAVKVENQLTEYKLRFFTNISHEFRTPLSIIQGDMERMNTVGNIPGELRQPMASMAKSVNRMRRLVNQLLEFRKMQNDKLSLALECTDVVEFLHQIFLNFKSVAEDKGINYLFLPFDRNYQMYVDRNYLDKIAYNLLSNALKYTPGKGEVMLRISLDGSSTLVISVEDSGIGVEKEKLPHLFERFNRSSYSHDSIGIGLHLTAELVRVHHGTISYRENQPHGSVFRVELPLDETVYQQSDFMHEDSALVLEDKDKPQPSDYKGMPPTPMNDYVVMVADDDNDVREFLARELQRYFHVVVAADGQEAWEKIQNEKPDLLVSDVMMPRMDGFKLVQKIRKDGDVADLPVIMLTALADDANEAKGIYTGADAYVEKPFSMELLVGRCCQLLNQRRMLKLFYSQQDDATKNAKVALPEIKKDEKDVRFQNQLDTWLADHLSDKDLNIDVFAEKMNYARTTFYKKIKSITGCTPNEYIRMKRMNKAVELLQDEHLTVAEVAYQVGFVDPFYFSKVFKGFFGVSPSTFREGT